MNNAPGHRRQGLMADFRDTNHGYPGGSRDFWNITLKCKSTDCICNTGRGECAVTARAIIGKKGKCSGYISTFKEKEKDA